MTIKKIVLHITLMPLAIIAWNANAEYGSAEIRVVQRHKDGLKKEPRCQKFHSRYDAALAKGTQYQASFRYALITVDQEAAAEKCIIPTPLNGLKE